MRIDFNRSGLAAEFPLTRREVILVEQISQDIRILLDTQLPGGAFWHRGANSVEQLTDTPAAPVSQEVRTR